jgi:hypothetical protein
MKPVGQRHSYGVSGIAPEGQARQVNDGSKILVALQEQEPPNEALNESPVPLQLQEFELIFDNPY